MTATVHRNCPLCDADNTARPALSYSPAVWPLKQCPHCAFVYLEKAATYAEMEEHFAWEKTSQAESRRRKSAEPLKQTLSDSFKRVRRDLFKRQKLGDFIRAYLPVGAVADVGCGTGNSLLRLPAHHTAIGLEISRALAAKAQRKVATRGGRVIAGDALHGLRTLVDGELSGVVMSAYLEHEIHPRALLTEVHRALRERGRVILKVPNYASWNRTVRGARWCGFRFPDHVNYFTPQTLARLGRETGFHVLRCRWQDCLPTSDNLWMVLEKSAREPERRSA